MVGQSKIDLTFLSSIIDRLDGISESWARGQVTINGQLPIDHRELKGSGLIRPITLSFNITRWNDLLPRVEIPQKYIHLATNDWHCFEDKSLCYALLHEWIYHYESWSVSHPQLVVSELMANWAMDSISRLIYYHHLGKIRNLVAWPSEWLCYNHDQEGIKEFYERKWKIT